METVEPPTRYASREDKIHFTKTTTNAYEAMMYDTEDICTIVCIGTNKLMGKFYYRPVQHLLNYT